MCKLLLPEERGEVGETELYAKTIADHFPNEQGDILYSYMVYRTTQAFGLEDYKTRLKFDWLRAKSGFVANAKLYPDDPAAICAPTSGIVTTRRIRTFSRRKTNRSSAPSTRRTKRSKRRTGGMCIYARARIDGCWTIEGNAVRQLCIGDW